MKPTALTQSASTHLARLAWGHLLGDDARPAPRDIRAKLVPIIAADVVDRWLSSVDFGALEGPRRLPVESVQQGLDARVRRRDGIYFTPIGMADGMAAAVDAEPGQVVVDPAAGAGTLLAAVARRRPDCRLVGVEKNEALAVAAAINLASVRAQQDGAAESDRIYVGDGLAQDGPLSQLEGRAAAVIANPPYVREKGNRQMFRALKSAHPHLADFFVARMDLQYLFFHCGASLLAPGGRLVLLTSAYWLTATSARTVREDLAGRLRPELFVRVEQAGVFGDAPGQHSLVSVMRRPSDERPQESVRAVSLPEEPDDWPGLIGRLAVSADRSPEVCEQAPTAFGADNWTPFVDRSTRRWASRLRAHGTPLGELVDDRQGFVSGADRFSARHPKRFEDSRELPERGEPIFLMPAEHTPAALSSLGATVLRPVLRASALVANEVIVSPPADELALYVDGPVSEANEAILGAHLERFRPVLEHRREVRKGSMPWYRLHWPRDRAEQTRPKLVVPRRAPAPCFALDLSASCISSDCTYLVAPGAVERPLLYLVTLMVVLNSQDMGRYLRRFGKSKGRQIEFYSEPLRALPLPLQVSATGRLEFVDELVSAPQRRALESHIEALAAEFGLRESADLTRY